MPQKYNFKVFVNLILFILVLQLNHLVNIYEMARIDFNVPTIDHLQKTPIEREVKIIYQQLPQRQASRQMDVFTYGDITGVTVYAGMYQ